MVTLKKESQCHQRKYSRLKINRNIARIISELFKKKLIQQKSKMLTMLIISMTLSSKVLKSLKRELIWTCQQWATRDIKACTECQQPRWITEKTHSSILTHLDQSLTPRTSQRLKIIQSYLRLNSQLSHPKLTEQVLDYLINQKWDCQLLATLDIEWLIDHRTSTVKTLETALSKVKLFQRWLNESYLKYIIIDI